ncbi:unnamed protein product [Fraxinus pennsylvanica]|uniref:Uncharacterized protein n=1 Tax=Fraxinus pennsylvanica TaxID=56036 RepID=A0AAD1YVV8_9LAMI|nr:unnamed protein product [Fraxinus pennsylvanica]
MVGYNILHLRKPLIKDPKFLTGFHDQICAFDYQEKNSDEKDCSFLNHALDDDDDDEEDEDIVDDEVVTNEPQDVAERTIYWESQESLLQEILERYSSSGVKFRKEINRHVEMATDSNFCDCPNPKLTGCSNCLRRRLVNQLCNKGFNAKLCTSKWSRTPKIPGGMHEYIEVIASTEGRKKQIPLLIEIGFQDEFMMAKACDEYCALINQLPKIYIGKPEHLNAIVHVVCDAAKRSTTEKKVHMGPWRKRSFMQMKWSASNEKSKQREMNTGKSLETSLEVAVY